MDCARNIITANFSGGTSATTAPLWQWDYGQVLCITGIEDLPAAFEVHFSTNRAGGVSTTAVGADGQVTIPNVLLTIGKNLNAWIYLSDAQGEGETEYSITIPVKARPMPEYYDAEVTGEFDDVVRQVSEYAQTAQTAATNAGASAEAAVGSASAAAASASGAAESAAAAEQARADAVTAKGQAETAAQTATEKAQQSAQNASQAASDAGRAESAANRTETAETGAEAAKTAAQTAANQSASYAGTASGKAALAEQSAEAAAVSATAAAQSAASIEGDVQTATAKAAEATAAAGQAVSAKDAAVTAQTAAETAATNAGQSASTATTKAAEAATSASNAAASESAAEAAATRAETAAASLTVDSALSDSSTNPVQNKVITGELTDVKSQLQDIGVEASSTAISAQRTVGYTINGSGSIVSAAGNYIIYTASVTPGKTYLVTASQNWSAPYYAYYDASMGLVQVGTSAAVGSAVTRIEKEKTVAPTGAAYLVSTSVNEVIADPISEFNGYYVLPRLDTVISDVSGLMHGVPIRNLFNPSKVLPGYYFNGSGTLIDNANSAYDDEYISVDPTEKYIANADGLQIVAYAADKTFIERAYNQEAAETYFTFNSNVAFVRVSRYGSAFPSNFIFATVKTYEFINGTSGDYVGSVTKTPTSLIVTTEKLKVIINKYNDSGIRAYNVWRANDAFICDENNVFQRLWYNSDSDGVVKLKDEDDFIGGYHGDETQTGFHLFVDGVEYSENSSFTDLTFDEIMLYCESDVYHCNTSNTPDVVAFKRNKIITFNKDGYSVSNYWVAQEAVTVSRAYMGMLSVERYTDQTFSDYLLTGYYTNHNYAYVDPDTATGGKPDITEVVFNTIYGDIGIEIKDVKTPGTYYADVTNFNSAYDKRLKAYLAPINSNNGVSVSAGQVIKAKATIFTR